MRELNMNEVNEVSGGPVPAIIVAIWAVDAFLLGVAIGVAATAPTPPTAPPPP